MTAQRLGLAEDAIVASLSLSIGQLSTRTGVDARTLRAWERRYGLFRPAREANGYRRYDSDDLDRARLMRRLTQQGTRAALAAEQILTLMPHPPGPAAPVIVEHRGVTVRRLLEDLTNAIEALDTDRADLIIDEAVVMLSEEVLIAEVIAPAMRRCVRAQTSARLPERVQAYFAAGVVRQGLRRLLARHTGHGPELWFVCPTDEQHEIGLLSLAVLAGKRGWDPVYFGAHTPLHRWRVRQRSVLLLVWWLAALDPSWSARTPESSSCWPVRCPPRSVAPEPSEPSSKGPAPASSLMTCSRLPTTCRTHSDCPILLSPPESKWLSG